MPGMKLWSATGYAFVVAGVLELSFLALSVMGVVVGGFMTIASLSGSLNDLEALMGPFILVIYALWFGATLVAGPLHIVAGATILAGRRSRPLIWAAIAASLLPVSTVYCAPTSLGAGILALVAILSPSPGAPDDVLPG
jgi:hypothetical protein